MLIGRSTLLDNRYQRISDKASKAGAYDCAAERAEPTGLILADVLASEVQGKRPVTLVRRSLPSAVKQPDAGRSDRR